MPRAGRKRIRPVRLHDYDGRFSIAPVQVEDPDNPGARLMVMANTAGRLYSARTWLNELQHATALRFQGVVERSGEAGAPAIDLSRPVVDVSRQDYSVGDARLEAVAALARIRQALGLERYTALRWLCAPDDALQGRGRSQCRQRAAVRAALDALAKFLYYRSAT
jgi:hypothetical protein